MVDTNKACKLSLRWILLVGLGSLVWTRLKTVCFVYDLGFEVQLLISNSQVITSSNQTPRDFPKQTPFNPTVLENLFCFSILLRHLGPLSFTLLTVVDFACLLLLAFVLTL